jgi:predicted secreted protein
MGWALGIAVYVVIWWLTLFTVLPFGVRSQTESENVVEGTDPGAPAAHLMGRKLLITTLIAGVIWLPVNFAYTYFYLGGFE